MLGKIVRACSPIAPESRPGEDEVARSAGGSRRREGNGAAEKAPADQAKAIIESAGFRIRKIVVRSTLPLVVEDGTPSGTAALIAHAAGKDAVYFFQSSTDQKNWTALPSVMKCKTTASGLTVGTTYYFRVQSQTRKGLGEWSGIVPFVAR